MIWGMTLEPGKLYTEVMGDEVHLSMATLESRKDFDSGEDGEEKPAPTPTCHIIMKTEKSEYLLCTLANGVIYQQSLDLKLMPREKVTFSVQGSNVVYLTGYSTSYPDMEDTLEEEESETGDWEPYDTGELLMNASNDETVALNEGEEQVAPVIKDESEDIIDEMADESSHQSEPVLELDLQTDLPEMNQENSEQTKEGEESDQQEMIFSIAELEANVKEEPEDDNVTIITSDGEERLQEQAEATKAEQMQQDQTQQHQLQEQQSQLQTQLQEQQQQRRLQLPPDQLHQQSQYLPNVQQQQQSMQNTMQTMPALQHQQRTGMPVNQRLPRYTHQRARARGRPSLSRLHTTQRQRVRYIQPTGQQQSFQQSQPSGNFPQMQQVQSTQNMPVGYQGTTVGNVALRGQASVNQGGMQGQAIVNQPGTSRQSVQGPSTSNSFTSEIIANPVVPGRKEGRRQFFHCRICFKTLSTARLAMRHELVHSGIRPFKCSYCNKTYAREECRVRHERTHTGVKLYKCDRCSESFTWYNTLRRHKDKCRGERFRLKDSTMSSSLREVPKSVDAKSRTRRTAGAATAGKPTSTLPFGGGTK